MQQVCGVLINERCTGHHLKYIFLYIRNARCLDLETKIQYNRIDKRYASVQGEVMAKQDIPRKKLNWTENKLLLLYFFSRVPDGLNYEELVRVNMDQEWMLPFDMQQILLELQEGDYVQIRSIAEDNYYRISAPGLEILRMYDQRIPLSIRTYIDEYTLSNRIRFEQEMEISADYRQKSQIDYAVELSLNEYYTPLLQVNISAPDEGSAKQIVRRFKQQAPGIYAAIIAQLTVDEEE